MPKLGSFCNITKLAGFEHTKYIQNNATHNKVHDTDIPLFIGRTIQNGKINTNFEWFIPQHISEVLTRSKLVRKSLVLPYVGTVGDLAIFDFDYQCHLGSNVAKIELNEGCDYSEEYIYYFLKSPFGQKLLLKDIQGGIQKNITMQAIRNVEIPTITRREQLRITNT